MKYFLFDIGNVLANFDFQILLQAYADDSGRPLAPQSDLDEAIYIQVETGELSESAYVEYLNTSKGLDWSVGNLAEVWQRIFTINPVGRGLYEQAIRTGVPVYTLSNIAQYHVDALEKNWSGFLEEATGLFMSYQMGVRKPDPQIYTMVLDQLDVDGEQCFFIDDLLENVEAARAVGIQAHQFIPANYAAVRKAADAFFGG